MRIKNFEDVQSWKMGKELFIDISREFGDIKDFTFKDQILRATLSITNNIAEGFDRGSDKEPRQFLVISRGSCAEVRSMLHIALATKKIDESTHKQLTTKTISISKLLTGFIKKIATSDKRPETNR